MSGARPFQVFANPRAGTPGTVVLTEAGFRRARAAIAAWDGYAATPLHDLAWAAGSAGVATVRMKDESGRFGLGSFKALGGAYAVQQAAAAARARSEAAPTVCCATEGNHGRSVAWGARRAGCSCVIFLHEGVSAAREAAIAAFGAEIRRVAGGYDDAVREAAAVAAREGWQVISDTSWAGYTTVPVEVMQGYRVLADEALAQWEGPPPTHCFVPAGVGGLAAALSVHLRSRVTPPPRLIVVEPEHAACLLASAEAGEMTELPGPLRTVMAGLACGVPSLLAWLELERAAAAFMAIPDEAALDAVAELAAAGLRIGAAGAAGLAALRLACADPAARATLGLDAASRVLLIGCDADISRLGDIG